MSTLPAFLGRLRFAALAATLLCCQASDAPREVARSAEPAPQPAAPAESRTAPARPAPPPPPPQRQIALGERLAREAKARPPHAVRIEDLIAALEDRGVAVARTRQVLGGTWGALYCAIAQTENGLGLATCEFASAEAARAGLAASKQRFDKLLPGRETLLNGQTVLTIAPRDPELDDESRTVTAIFAGLATP